MEDTRQLSQPDLLERLAAPDLPQPHPGWLYPDASPGGPGLDDVIRRAQEYLLAHQQPGGYWQGELEADASVTAGYLHLMTFMTGRVDPARKGKIIAYVGSRQNPDGSWSVYPGGPGDLNVSIQIYLDLKLAGVAASEDWMLRAQEFIRSQGGVMQSSVFTKVWLALFGQFDWRGVPGIPPEIIFFPSWFPFNIYEFASWSRATIMALAIVTTLRPLCTIPAEAGVSELYLAPPTARDLSLGLLQGGLNWRNFFLIADRLFKAWDRLPFKPGRATALRQVERWIVQHQESDGSWGGIMLPWIYSLYALKGLGYPSDHPVIVQGLRGLEDFIVEDQYTLRMEPAVSPVWDTAWSTLALRAAGLPAQHPALQRAAGWLLTKEIRRPGDWKVKNSHIEPGGWAFEFQNDWYPDLDDSAVVPRALQAAALPPEQQTARAQAVARAHQWVTAMQSKDGGWAAFDRDNDRQFLRHAPFVDFMSPLDPTCADVTAHVLEFLAEVEPRGKSLAQAVVYLRQAQEPDGAWYGRWGVNYIYGTGLALSGLRAAGEDMTRPYIRKAVDWLAAHQNLDGGWGESCHTYQDPAGRGQGPSTASQTGWALMGLAAAGCVHTPAARRGLDYLLKTQAADGSWPEPFYTGGGFPRVFYLRYDLYRIYFPLLALARCQEEMLS